MSDRERVAAPAPARTSRWRARLIASSLGVVLPLAGAELSLQALAYSRHRARVTAPPPGHAQIVCAGDSFTFGLGSSAPERAYPACLERELTARGAGLRVANAGWPGATSRDVLERLDAVLLERTPRLVYLLIGLNDFTTRPELLDVPPRGPRERTFQFEPRVWKLATLLVAHLRGDLAFRAADGAQLSFLGVWNNGSIEVRFHADGRWELGSDCTLAWRVAGETLLLRFADGSEHACAWARTDDSLRLAIDGRAGAYALARGPLRERATPPTPHAETRIRALVAAGELARALELEQELDPGTTNAHVARAIEALSLDPSSHDRLETMIHAARGDARAPARAAVWLAMAHARLLARTDPRAALRVVLESELAHPDATRTRREIAINACSREVFEQVLASLAIPAPEARRLSALYETPDARDAAIRATLLAHVARAGRLCREHGAELVLVGYPGAPLRVDAAVHAAAESNRVAFVATRMAFDEAVAARGYERLFAPDGHCADAGYALLAQLVARDALTRL